MTYPDPTHPDLALDRELLGVLRALDLTDPAFDEDLVSGVTVGTGRSACWK